MMTPEDSSPLPNEEGVRYERIDDLTVHVYVEGPGDTNVRRAHPAVQKILERDREQIAEMIARTRREQERLNARQQTKPDKPNPV
jgi:hypothetical protein